MNILMTSGGTREPVDGVRHLTNFSTGRTGAFICDHFRRQGHNVLFLKAENSVLPLMQGPTVEFTTFQSLEDLLKLHLSTTRFDAVIHLAAISDYAVESIEIGGKIFEPGSGKINSDAERMSLHLKRNPKLIGQLKNYAKGAHFVLVGFKLTNTSNATERMAAVEKLANNYDVQLIVQNDLSDIEKSGRHITRVYEKNKDGKITLLKENQTKEELAIKLENCLKELL